MYPRGVGCEGVIELKYLRTRLSDRLYEDVNKPLLLFLNKGACSTAVGLSASPERLLWRS
jgi:hypothetical protein